MFSQSGMTENRESWENYILYFFIEIFRWSALAVGPLFSVGPWASARRAHWIIRHCVQRRRKRHQRRNGPTRPRSASRPAGAAGRLLLCGRRDGDTARHSGAPSATIRLSNIQWRKDSVSYLYIGTTRTLGTGQQLVSELSVADEDYLILTFLFNVPDMIR